MILGAIVEGQGKSCSKGDSIRGPSGLQGFAIPAAFKKSNRAKYRYKSNSDIPPLCWTQFVTTYWHWRSTDGGTSEGRHVYAHKF